jgi:hypothetical protein
MGRNVEGTRGRGLGLLDEEGVVGFLASRVVDVGEEVREENQGLRFGEGWRVSIPKVSSLSAVFA